MYVAAAARNILLISQGSQSKEVGHAVVSFLPPLGPRLLPPQQSVLRLRLLYNPHLVLSLSTPLLHKVPVPNDRRECTGPALKLSHNLTGDPNALRCGIISKG